MFKENKGKICILNAFLDNLNLEEFLLIISKFLKEKKPHQIITLNSEMLSDAQKDKEFLEIINNSNLAVADGAGIMWAANFLALPTSKISFFSYPQVIFQAFYTLFLSLIFPSYFERTIKERLAGADLIWKISKLASKEGYSIFFLGGGEGVAEKTGERIKKHYPSLKIAGFYPGSPQETEKILKMVNSCKADILFVAWGAPKQDKWIAHNLKNFETVKIAIGVGGAFDFIVGKAKYYGNRKEEKVKRAPFLMRKIGLEWFWRFLIQPWRWKRILKAVPLFIFQVVKYKLELEKKNGKN